MTRSPVLQQRAPVAGAAPLLKVRGLVKHFPVGRALFGKG